MDEDDLRHLMNLYAERDRFVRGRLRFGNGDCSAPFPSAVIVFGGPRQQARFGSIVFHDLQPPR